MGKVEKEQDRLIFRQANGEITAWFDNFEEKMVLSHKGNSKYKIVFFVLVVIGFIYLAAIFFSL